MKKIDKEKKILRNSTKERPLFKSDEEDQRIIENFLNSDLYKKAGSIFITISFNDEINTVPIINQALKDNKKVYVPKTIPETRGMIPVQIQTFPAGLKKNDYGILEPAAVPESYPITFDLIVTPGLLFNREGYRLGYGGGYYDRFLQNNPSPTISLCRNDQLVDTIPHDTFDQRVDYLQTPDELIRTEVN